MTPEREAEIRCLLSAYASGDSSEYHQAAALLLRALDALRAENARLREAMEPVVRAAVLATFRACVKAEFGPDGFHDWRVDLKGIVTAALTPEVPK